MDKPIQTMTPAPKNSQSQQTEEKSSTTTVSLPDREYLYQRALQRSQELKAGSTIQPKSLD